MSGYRQHSFDPNAWEQPGPPLRPFNWVQWTGVALGTIGIAFQLVYFAGRLGWIPPLIDQSSPTFVLVILGVVLINSRRQPAHDPAPELADARKRWLIVTAFVRAAILGFAAALDLLGA